MSNYWGVPGSITLIPNERQEIQVDQEIHHFNQPMVISSGGQYEKDLQCSECKVVFDSKQKLDRHQLKHSEVRSFACMICQKAFKTKSNMAKHQKIHDTGPFNCIYCHLLFLRRKECDQHSKLCPSKPVSVKQVKSYKKKEFECHVCQKIFYKNSHVKRHIACVHENLRNFKCSYVGCNKAFNDVTDLGKHQKIVHLKIREAQCHLCDAQYPFNSLLQRHMKIAHDENRNKFSCDLCSRTFPIKAKILKHMRTAHMMIPSGSCVCEFCGKIVSSSSILGHVSTVHLKQCPRDFICVTCGAAFPTKNKLEYHYHHKHSDARNFACKLCQKAFKMRSDLMQHQQMHDIVKFQCTYCLEKFTTEVEFERHPNECPHKPSKIRKIKKKEFICDVCQKQFKKTSHLKRHIICIHENKRNFRCNFEGCSKAFNDQTDLRKHKNTVHNKSNKELKFECNFCSALFATHSILTKHLKSHEGFGKKFSCELCLVTFEGKGTLIRHMKTKHLNEAKEEEISIKEENETPDKVWNYERIFTMPIKIEESDQELYNEFSTNSLEAVETSEIEVKSEREDESHKTEVLKASTDQSESELEIEKYGVQQHSEEDNQTETEEFANPKKKFECKFKCGKWYRKNAELERHINYVHNGIKEFQCSIEDCKKTFAYEKSLKHHISVHHSESSVKIYCDRCDKVFVDRDGLRKHQKSVHEGIRYECNMCEKKFSRKSILKKHVDSKHNSTKPIIQKHREKVTKVTCIDCGLLIWKTGLLRHRVRVHNYPINTFFECDFCGCNKQLRDDMVNHMKINHMPKTRCKLPCETCGQQLANRKALRNHIKFIHEKKIQDICEHCGLGFLDRERYVNHVRSKHTLEKPYVCPYKDCNKAFSVSSSLRNHKIYEHSKDVSVCEICSKTFSNYRYLRNHQRLVHSMDPKIKTDKSSTPKKKIVQNTALKKETSREFKCLHGDCGLSFSTSKKLRNHQEFHSGDRKHLCKLCNSAYRKRDGLITHIRVVHFKFQINCLVPNCTAKYVRKDFLRGHIKSAHAELPEHEVQYLFQKIEEIPLPSIQSYNDIASTTV